MKSIRFILGLMVVTVATAFVSCSKEGDPGIDESAAASTAMISSTDSLFTATGVGGSVAFDNLGGTVAIRVDCDADWTAVSDEDWLEVSVSVNAVLLIVDENIEFKANSAMVTLMTKQSEIEFATITVSQDESAPHDEAFFARHQVLSSDDPSFISTDRGGTVSFTSEGGWIRINVECEVSDLYFEWDVTTDADWLDWVISDDALTLISARNDTYYSKTCTVTLATAESGIEFANLTVNLLGIEIPEADRALILEYTIDAGATVYLPLYGTVACDVDWGDGSDIEQVFSNYPSHTYSEAGMYDVSVTGAVTRLNSFASNIASSTSPDKKLTAVKQWGMLDGLTSMQNAFRYCDNLASIPADKYGTFRNVETFYYTFANCPVLEDIPTGLFEHCTMVTDFTAVFRECSALIKIPEGLFDNCKGATTLADAFYMCSDLGEIPDYLFANNSEVTSFRRIFYNCTGLTEIPGHLFDNCTKVEDMSYVFCNCSGIRSIPEGLFDDCHGVTTLADAFYKCTNLEDLPDYLFANNLDATDMNRLFYMCTGLTEIPGHLFDNCTKVEDMSYVFYGCTALESVPTGLFDDCSQVTNFADSFYNCKNWSGESPYTMVGEKKVHLYERADYGDYFAAPETYSLCYYNCSKLTDYNLEEGGIPDEWK